MRKFIFILMIIALIVVGVLLEKAEIYSNEVKSQSTQSREIVHKAVRGCILTGSDSITGKVSFEKHCDECGYTETGSTSTYLTQDSQTYTSKFTCPNCNAEKDVLITTIVM